MSTAKYIVILLVLLALLAVAYGFRAAFLPVVPVVEPDTSGIPSSPVTPSAPVGGEPVFCTLDAMMCPDGTYVGRTGPNCEFICPSTGSSDSSGDTTSSGGTALYERVTLSLNEARTIGATTIKPWAVTEDSRCPMDVMCIQMGRVRVAFEIGTPSGTSIAELEPGKTITTETLSITLDEVQPYPMASRKTQDSEYRFVVLVRGK